MAENAPAAQRPYVVFAESNLKGGIRVSLAPKTLIIGPNGTGKSAVVNTVELATSGRVSDLRGRREVAKESDLMELSPGPKVELLARALLSNGQDCVWRAGGKKKAASHKVPDCVNIESVFPLRPVHDAVLGNIDTARKFFIQYAVGAITDKDVLARIPESLHPFYKRATLQTSLSTGSPVDRLLSALEHAKKQARDAEKQAKAAESVSSDAAQGLAPLPTEAEEKALADAVREAQSRVDAAKRVLTQRETVDAALKERDELQSKLKLAEQAYLAAQQEAVASRASLEATPVPQAASDEVLALRATIEAHTAVNAQGCQCCGAASVVPGSWAARLAALDAWFASQREATAAYENAKARHTTAMVKEQQAFNEGKAVYERAQAVAAVLKDIPTEVPTLEYVMACEEAVQKLRDRQREIDVLKASWAAVSRGKDSVNDAKVNAETWDKLVDACMEAIKLLLDAGVSGFQSRVQAFLPERDRYAVMLRDGDKPTFRYGLKRGSMVHTALSGAEWARVMAAMAAVCKDPSPKMVSLVVPEERAFDAVTLFDVLTSFTDIDGQVLVASPIAPASIPAGWLVVDTTQDEHRHGTPPLAESFDAPAVPM
jgi:hypothetical protein